MHTTKIGSEQSMIRQALVATHAFKPRPANSASLLEVKPAAPAPADVVAFNAKAAPIDLASSMSSTARSGSDKSEAMTAETTPPPSADVAPENISPGELETTDSADDQTPLTIAGFHDAWGQSNSPYDLNGDGTVNMDDLLQFIASQPAPTPTPVAGEPADVTPVDLSEVKPLETPSADVAPQPVDPLPTDPPATADVTPESRQQTSSPTLTIDGLLAAWSNGPATGAELSMYDLNADGTVNMDDLLQLIGQLSPGNSGNARLANDASNNQPTDAVPASAQSHGRANAPHTRLNTLVNSLIDRLNQAGFEQQPPTNIRELVTSLDLSPSQTNAAIKQLHGRYPRGLGVNVTA